MSALIQKSVLRHTAYAGALLIAIGLPLFPALQSIGVALIFLHPFLNGTWKQLPQEFLRNKLSLALGIFYILTVLSILYTSNTQAYLTDIRVKLPFLMLGIGLCIPAIPQPKRWMVIYVLVAAVFVTGLLSFLEYLQHFKADNELLIHSKPIPIFKGVNHIYFSVLLAFSACIVLFQLLMGGNRRGTYWYLLGISIFILLVVFLHSISARTGLMCFYGGLAVLLACFVIIKRKYMAGLIMVLLAGAVLIGSLKYVPALQNRISNTREDIGRLYNNKEINHYSISMRMAALDAAFKVFKKAPILGVGPADVPDEIQKQHQAEHSSLLPEYQRMEPHNQFVETLVSLGIAGFLILCFIIFYPLFVIRWKEHIVFLLFITIMILSMQVESMLERQVGVTFFCLFYMMLPRLNALEK